MTQDHTVLKLLDTLNVVSYVATSAKARYEQKDSEQSSGEGGDTYQELAKKLKEINTCLSNAMKSIVEWVSKPPTLMDSLYL